MTTSKLCDVMRTSRSRFVTSALGWITALVLVCMGWVAPPPAWSQTCISDGGQSVCTKLTPGSPTWYNIEGAGIGIIATGSDQDVYNKISAWASVAFCTNYPSYIPQPPYTWTLSPNNTNYPNVTYTTTIQISGTQGYCPYSNLQPITVNWDVTKFQPQGCYPGWNPDGAPTPSYPLGHCFHPPFQSCQAGQPTQCAGDPIDPISGNEVEREVDYSAAGSALQFVRTYNYLGTLTGSPSTNGLIPFGPGSPSGLAGRGWSHTYERRLWTLSSGVIRALRPDGSDRFFLPVSGGYQEFGTGVEQLTTSSSGGWVLTDSNDTQEIYDGSGTLQTITFRGGQSLSLSYSTAETRPTIAPSAGLLLAVTDNFGHQLGFTYNGLGLIATMTDPNGGVYTYGYSPAPDSTDQGPDFLLSSVTYPDSTSRQYLYNEGAETQGNNPSYVYAYALTGIIDEAGTRYATISYNNQGQAIASQLAGGVDAYSISNINYRTDYGYGSSNVTDPLGTTRNYQYTAVGGVAKYTGINTPCPSCPDAPANVGYDANGNVSSRTDYNGNQTTYVYDLTRNLETSRTEAAGSAKARTITTSWNPSYRLPNQIVEPNRTTSFAYDGSGNLLTKTVVDTMASPNASRTWTYTYNSYGQVLTAKSPRTDVNSTTTYTYYSCTSGAQCGRVQTITDALGHATTFNTYNGNGQPLTITDPNGVLTTLTYDARSRLTSRSTAGETTSFSYYPTGLLNTVTLADGSSLTYTYDGAHRLTQISDGLGNKIAYTLDAAGNRIAENTTDPSGVLHRTHSRAFNTFNELYQDINAAGTAAVTTTYGYDSNGNQTSIAAPLSRNTANAYDALNRLSQVTDPSSGVTHFGYDANDNLTSVVDPRSLTTSYSYSGFGDLVAQSSPDTGSTSITYDAAGNLVTSTDARGAVATYQYDTLNRVSSVAYQVGGTTDQTIAFTYDAGTNGIGHLTGASDANHALSWTYDALGRVTGKTQTVGGLSAAVAYTYTKGDLTTLITPAGRTITYGYNTNHQVISVAVNGTLVLNGVTYEPFGAVDGWTWGNGTATVRSFDTDGDISSITSSMSRSYSYDSAQRITGITDNPNSALSWIYGYDSLDRLSSAGSSAQSESFTYDANGNRLSQAGTLSTTYAVASGSNQLSSITGAISRTYSYDAAGHTTGYGDFTFTYNGAGRVSSVTGSSGTATYVYNAVGQRVRKTTPSGTTLFVYDEAGHLLGEYDGSGSVIEEIVWLGDTPVASIRQEACGLSIFYIHTDHLNTPRRITRRSTSDVVWSWDSDPFGTTGPSEDPSGLGTFSFNLRFPGQYFDGETGLHYNYFRDYDPAVGRYIESDPAGLAAGINTYAYVTDDPILFFDPDGLGKQGGQTNIGGNDPAMPRNVTPSSPQSVRNAAIANAEKVLKEPGINPQRARKIRGWIKVLKRGHRALCPPFLEELAIGTARELCEAGDQHMCSVFQMLGGEIDWGT
jgi:RHS repeat-associated protein